MTKEEKIIDSYGIYWESLSQSAKDCALNHNGYVAPLIGSSGDIPRSFIVYDDWGFRPKTLIGIANNNGWCKVESDEDLPKENGEFWVIQNDETRTVVWYEKDFKQFFDRDNIALDENDITHYRPLEIPKSPIY